MYQIGKFYKWKDSNKFVFIVDIQVDKAAINTTYYAKKIILYLDKLNDPSWTMATKGYEWLSDTTSETPTEVEPPKEIYDWVKDYLDKQLLLYNRCLNALLH